MTQPTLVSRITIDHLRALDFWRRVDVRLNDDCWEWTGGANRAGYGVVHVGARITGFDRPIACYAHRVALSLHLDRVIDPAAVVDHRCFNTRCCNPAHIEPVAQLTNVRRSRKTLIKPKALKDGWWSVRHYDYSTGARRYVTSHFQTEHDALAFILSIRHGA